MCVPGPGLPENLLREAQENLPRRYPRNEHDTFAFVKRFVSDSAYSQRPLVTWPGVILQETNDALERLAGTRCRGLARVCVKHYI